MVFNPTNTPPNANLSNALAFPLTSTNQPSSTPVIQTTFNIFNSTYSLVLDHPSFSAVQLNLNSDWDQLINQFHKLIEVGHESQCYKLFHTNKSWMNRIDTLFKLKENPSKDWSLLSLALAYDKFSLVKFLVQLGANPGLVINGEPLYLTALNEDKIIPYFEACEHSFPMQQFACFLSNACRQSVVEKFQAFRILELLQKSRQWSPSYQKELSLHYCFHYYYLIDSLSWAFDTKQATYSFLQRDLKLSYAFEESIVAKSQIFDLLSRLDDVKRHPLPPLNSEGVKRLNHIYDYPCSSSNTILIQAIKLQCIELIPLLVRLGAVLTPDSLSSILKATVLATNLDKGTLHSLYQAYGQNKLPVEDCIHQLYLLCFPLSSLSSTKTQRIFEAFEEMKLAKLMNQAELAHPDYVCFLQWHSSNSLSNSSTNSLPWKPLLAPLAYTSQDMVSHFQKLDQSERLFIKSTYTQFADELGKQWLQAHRHASKPLPILQIPQGYLQIDLSDVNALFDLKPFLTLWETMELSLSQQKILAHHLAYFLNLSCPNSFSCPSEIREAILSCSTRPILPLISQDNLQLSLPPHLLEHINTLFFRLKIQEWLFHTRDLSIALQQGDLPSSSHPCFVIRATTHKFYVYGLNLTIHPIGGLKRITTHQENNIATFLRTLAPHTPETAFVTELDEKTMPFFVASVQQSPDCFVLCENKTYVPPQVDQQSTNFSCDFWRQLSLQNLQDLNELFPLPPERQHQPPTMARQSQSLVMRKDSSPMEQESFPPMKMEEDSPKKQEETPIMTERKNSSMIRREPQTLVPLQYFKILPIPDIKENSYQSALQVGVYFTYQPHYLKFFTQQVLGILDKHPEYRNAIRKRQWSYLTQSSAPLSQAYQKLEENLRKFESTFQKTKAIGIEIYEYNQTTNPTLFVCQEKRDEESESRIYLLRKYNQREPYFDLLLRCIYPSVS